MTTRPPVDVQNARTRARGDYAAALAEIAAEGLCPFCEEHLVRYHKKPVLFRDAHWLVTENAWPYDGARHQFLVIARRHVERAEDLPPAAWEALGAAYRRLVGDYALAGATLFLRSGLTDFTGASVAHLHAQVISGARRRPHREPIRALVAFKQRSG
jgi:diadenosine tetraphosphate (Ap4A) HIT family hydrolase